MALTIANVKPLTPGPSTGGYRMRVTFDNSYPTGGEVLDLSDYLSTIEHVQVSAKASGYVIQHDHGTPAAGVLQAFEAGADAAPLDEVADTTDLSAVVCDVLVFGTPV